MELVYIQTHSDSGYFPSYLILCYVILFNLILSESHLVESSVVELFLQLMLKPIVTR